MNLSPSLDEDLEWREWTARLLGRVEEQIPPDRDEQTWNSALNRTLRELSASVSVHRHRVAIEAYLRLIADLGKIGWAIEISDEEVLGGKPQAGTAREEKRAQLTATRNSALRRPNVRRFVRKMEHDRRLKDRVVSIFSLMRDGRELAADIRAADRDVSAVVKPYVHVVGDSERCQFTDIELHDVWRYFRLTWTNPPRSIPARQLRFLVRDAGAQNHPVMGIGELSGAAIRVAPRDEFIGWSPSSMTDWITGFDGEEVVCWIEATLAQARTDVYSEDLPDPREAESASALIQELRAIEAEARIRHEQEAGRRSLPAKPADMTRGQWRERALTPLFRSKRAGKLADLFALELELKPVLSGGDGPALREALKKPTTKNAIGQVLTLAKSRRQGTAIADLTVCGAIPPYNHLIGGKLVALLAGSPVVVKAYEDRYEGVPSIIASSMAAKPVVKESKLVLLSTTGLYGVRPSQYDRITASAGELGGAGEDRLRYNYLSQRTAGWGTFQFSSETRNALQQYLQLETGRKRVSYTYGEGASPTMRLLREGVSNLGLDAEELLVHGLEKSLYVFPLVRNAQRYLIGMDRDPDYLLPLHEPERIQAEIGRWWADRWASKRTGSRSLETLESENLVRPVTHAARVRLPEAEEQIPLFGDLG